MYGDGLKLFRKKLGTRFNRDLEVIPTGNKRETLGNCFSFATALKHGLSEFFLFLFLLY